MGMKGILEMKNYQCDTCLKLHDIFCCCHNRTPHKCVKVVGDGTRYRFAGHGCFRQNNHEEQGPKSKIRKKRNLEDECSSRIAKKGSATKEKDMKVNKGKGIVTESESESEDSSDSDYSLKILEPDHKKPHQETISITSSPSHDSFIKMESCEDSSELVEKKAKEHGAESRRRAVTYEERKRAKIRAQQFVSNKPNFRKEMKTSDVHTDFTLNISTKFARANLPSSSTQISLRVAAEKEGKKNTGKKWQILCNYGGYRTQRQWRVFSGWKEFSLDNNLEEGDWCVFEMTKSFKEKIEFTVRIFRVVEESG